MTTQTPINNVPPPPKARKKSVLVPLGILLILLGLLVPNRLAEAAQSMQRGSVRSISFLATDLFRACFFLGIGCAIIGTLRNRKLKGELPKNDT